MTTMCTSLFCESGISPLLQCLRRQAHPKTRFPTTSNRQTPVPLRARPHVRSFTNTSLTQSWLQPRREASGKEPKGRPRVSTAGSTRGTTVIWGDYGLRLRDHDRRIASSQLRNGEDAIRRRLRGINHQFFARVHAGTPVCEKGNESRMGTGKGKFNHWAARVPISRVVFELKADCHEQVVRDAMRLAANKLPGLWEFVKRGDPPVMGLTKLGPTTLAEDLRRPRRKLPGENIAGRIPATT